MKYRLLILSSTACIAMVPSSYGRSRGGSYPYTISKGVSLVEECSEVLYAHSTKASQLAQSGKAPEVHVDGSSQQPEYEFDVVRLELERFSHELAEKHYIVAYNKIDIPPVRLMSGFKFHFLWNFGSYEIEISMLNLYPESISSLTMKFGKYLEI